ncbi:histidine kinase [Pseudoduganella sp. LjRoot289]|uniref:sensor histidine kinase n=1 Tax=Pseudoduganella sp. LjRoot289 TaxID=3342314 RepID=UPI003ECFD47A
MSAQAQPVHFDAQRAAELSELLGHVNACWDNERRSLSRQLHDSMGSSLTALTMHLGLLTQKLPPDPALMERATQMKNLLHNIIETNRQMQHRLWNDKLEFLGVRVALGELVTQFGEQHGVAARCSLPEEEPRCPRSHNVVLLRALEEALHNIVSHAQASSVDVVVDDNDDEIMLTVKDNGVGVSAHSDAIGADNAKHGLRVLRERAVYLGGTLTLVAGADGGTTLTVVLPKPAP